MAEWRRLPLGQLISVKHGFAFPGDEFSEDPRFPTLVTPGNFAIGGGFKETKPKTFAGEYPREFVLAPGALVVTMTDLSKEGATLGLPAIVPQEGVFLHNQRIGLIEAKDPHVSLRFLNYYLRTIEYRSHILATASGSTVRHTSPSRIGEFVAPIPSREEQEAIADVLSALDDKIAANSAANATSDMLIESLYRRALADPATTEVPFFEAFDADFGEPFVGRGFTTPGNGRPLIRIRDLKTFAPQVWTIEQREREVVINPGEVVVGMDAEFRPTWWLGEPGLLNQRVCRVSSRHAGSAFVGEALRSPLRAIEEYKSGTTVIHLNKSDLALTRVALPPSLALAEFDAEAEPLLRRRVASAHESRALAATRDALLPALMSGRLRVRDAAERIDSVGP